MRTSCWVAAAARRTITITPAAGITTVIPVTITLTVSDSIDQAQMQYTLNVTPPPTTYLATLSPVSSGPLGYGSATIVVAGDKKSALMKYSYSNLSSADTDDAIDGPGDEVLYDIPVAKAAASPAARRLVALAV